MADPLSDRNSSDLLSASIYSDRNSEQRSSELQSDLICFDNQSDRLISPLVLPPHDSVPVLPSYGSQLVHHTQSSNWRLVSEGWCRQTPDPDPRAHVSVRVQHPAGPSIPAKYTCTDVASDLIPDPSACVWSYVKTKNKAPAALDQQDEACTAIACSMQPRGENGHLTGAKKW